MQSNECTTEAGTGEAMKRKTDISQSTVEVVVSVTVVNGMRRRPTVAGLSFFSFTVKAAPEVGLRTLTHVFILFLRTRDITRIFSRESSFEAWLPFRCLL